MTRIQNGALLCAFAVVALFTVYSDEGGDRGHWPVAAQKLSGTRNQNRHD